MDRRKTVACFVASLLYWAAQYIYVPTLPAFVRTRAGSLTQVGIILAMYGLWSAILRIPTGIVLDATGRSRRTIIGGFLLAAAGAVVMGRGETAGALTLGRALTGASTATWVPVMVMFAGFFPAERAVFATSLLASATSIGQVVATASTGLLNRVGGYPLAFYVGACLALAATALIATIRLPPPGPSHDPPVNARSILAIFARRDVLLPSFASAVCQFGVWAVVFAFLPLLARQLGAGDVALGMLMTVNLLANAGSNLFTTLWVHADRQRLFLFGSFGLFAGGAVLAGVSASLPLLFVATALMGAANGIFYPVLLGQSIQRVDLAHRTTAMGIHQAVYAIGMFAGPWIGGILSDALGIRSMFAIIAGFCLAASGVLAAMNTQGDSGRWLPRLRSSGPT
jgi:MFS family permease